MCPDYDTQDPSRFEQEQKMSRETAANSQTADIVAVVEAQLPGLLSAAASFGTVYASSSNQPAGYFDANNSDDITVHRVNGITRLTTSIVGGKGAILFHNEISAVIGRLSTESTSNNLWLLPFNPGTLAICNGSTGQIVSNDVMGDLTGNDATPDCIGEYAANSLTSASAVALTNNVTVAFTGIMLSAGDWDVEGNVNLKATTATFTGAVTSFSLFEGVIASDGSEVNCATMFTLLTKTEGLVIPRFRVNLFEATMVYINIRALFSAGTVAAYGSITARRVR